MQFFSALACNAFFNSFDYSKSCDSLFSHIMPCHAICQKSQACHVYIRWISRHVVMLKCLFQYSISLSQQYQISLHLIFFIVYCLILFIHLFLIYTQLFIFVYIDKIYLFIFTRRRLDLSLYHIRVCLKITDRQIFIPQQNPYIFWFT